MKPEDYVTYPTAKLLREAGFPQEYKRSLGGTLIAQEDGTFCRPSLWDAMKWLRDKQYIHVNPIYNQDLRGGWECYFENLTPAEDLSWDVQSFVCPTQTSYESASDAGIAAACKWLIAKYKNIRADSQDVDNSDCEETENDEYQFDFD